MLKVGIDIGGTKIAGGVVDAEGRIVEKLRVDTPVDTARARGCRRRHGPALRRRARDRRRRASPRPGSSTATAPIVIHAPNIDWRDEPLKRDPRSAHRRPVTIENDANAAGWAEFRFGAGRDVDDMVMLTMGTGVGGAVIANGALYRGGHGIAGELGHIRFTRDGLPCGCGQNGCLEQYASGRALQRAGERDRGCRRHRRRAGRRPRAEGHRSAVRPMSRLVLAGDPGAIEALRRVATALGEACGGFQAVLDPELFVIGGGVAQLGEDLLEPVRIAYETSLPGYGDRPVAALRDRGARQRRGPHRRRPTSHRHPSPTVGAHRRCSTG